MTHKLEKMLKMLPLVALFLLLTTDFTNSSGFGEKFRFSPDIWDDRYCVVATRVYNGSQEGTLIKIIDSERPSNIKTTCFAPFQLSKELNMLSLSRLSNKTILLLAYEYGQNDLKLILINTQNCKYDYAYKGAVPPNNHLMLLNRDPSDERFSIIMNGKTNCRGYNWCRLFFDPFYQKFQALDLDFDPYAVFLVAPTPSNKNNFLVRLDDLYNNVHRIRLYNISNDSASPEFKELMTFDHYINYQKFFNIAALVPGRNILGWGFSPFNYEVKFNGLSFCWCLDQGNKFIHCSTFGEDGSVKINQTLVYPEAMFPLRVQDIPNGIILFSLKANRLTSADWTTVKIAVITNNVDSDSLSGSYAKEENQSVQIKHRQQVLDCSKIVAWKTKVNKSDGSIEVIYMCLDESSTSIHSFYIQ